MSDEALLELRLRELPVKIKGSVLEERLIRLDDELEAKGLRFRPYTWLSDDWYTPVGVTGFAIPFYLAHPRLVKLEKKLMFEAEGESATECMKILRHEAGHALQNAYRLGRRRGFREIFGSSREPYPEAFQPKPYSRKFVLHFDYWYAQAHPDEDFAETFAVWLTPNSRWRKRYEGWPAMKKLLYVDELMKEIGPKPPPVRTRVKQDVITRLNKTVREHYDDRRKRYGAEYPDFYDRDLRRLFPVPEATAAAAGIPAGAAEAAEIAAAHARAEPAATFLRRAQPDLRRRVARWTGTYAYTIDQVLTDMIERARALNLRAARPRDELMNEAAILLTVQTMNYLHSGRHRIAL